MAKPKSVLLACMAGLAVLLVHDKVYAQDAQEYIVQFRAGTSAGARGGAAASAGAAVRFDYRRFNAAAVRVPNERALIALQQHPSVVSIVPNRPVSAYQRGAAKGGKPGGGEPSSQVLPAGVDRVAGRPAPSDGAGVGVAILDTGVDLAHPDLTGTVNAFSAFGSSCQDDEGHGTHVAGIVAARDNGIDVIGVAPGARLYCVKVLNNTGNGSDATVIAGLQWVLDAVSAGGPSGAPPIRVVNMSLGRPGTVDDNPTLRDAVAALDAAGVSIVVAAGNDPSADVGEQIPAAYPEVISVASTTALAGSNQCRFLSSGIARDTASYFTTDGVGVSVSAPGEDKEDVNRGCFIQSTGILSTKLGGGTTRMSGTSMAAPHVAGIAARYHQQADFDETGPYTAAFVRSLIVSHAQQAGALPLDSPAGSYSFDGIREGIAQAPPSVPVP